MTRALVVEDEVGIAKLNKRLLEAEGFETDIASTAEEGISLAQANDYDLVMLDIALPDGNGISVLKSIREKSRTTPVLIVSGSGDLDATVFGLDAGADDYLHKPYRASELSARIRALMRRSRAGEQQKMKCGNLTLDRNLRDAIVGDRQLHLAPKEFLLLEYFVRNRGKTLTRTELLAKVWRFDFDPGTHVVNVNVSRLRRKLKTAGATCRVESERGVGYVFSEQ
jgi:DNA-binding response OmpR family regulator